MSIFNINNSALSRRWIPVTSLTPVKCSATTRKEFIYKNLGTVLLGNLLMTMPAHAGSGKVFDFNATLPIMAAQFLLLMLFLDRTWFSPVGKVLDERDANIRARLLSVDSDTGELESLQNEAENLLKNARAEAQARIAESKNKASSQAQIELAVKKSKLDSELVKVVKELDAEKANVRKDLEDKVSTLSEYITGKILPDGFKLN